MRKGITKQQLREIIEKPFYQNTERGKESATRVKDALTGRTDPFAKRPKQASLVQEAENSANCLNIDVPVLIRLVRLVPKGRRFYDDDNWVACCKQIRDATVALLGLTGDDIEDGVHVEYEQRKTTGIGGIDVEIYKITCNDGDND